MTTRNLVLCLRYTDMVRNLCMYLFGWRYVYAYNTIHYRHVVSRLRTSQSGVYFKDRCGMYVFLDEEEGKKRVEWIIKPL